MSRLGDTLPATLTLPEQSLFALGYYQQKARMAADRLAAKAAKSTKEEQ